MVSLNEKRSKVRYVIQGKTEWVEDDNKFGKRMLEKMGWTSGVGLGKNEDGRTEHIDMKFKSNLKGVGFVNGKYDDTWLSHSQSFDSVLEQLQQSHPTSTPSSLHNFNQTVRETKTRFTYKKQSSGKDLSSRSNSELDCIFGWNKISQNNAAQVKQDEETRLLQETEAIAENLYVTSKQSIHDYFRQKLKKKSLSTFQQNNAVDESSPGEEVISAMPAENTTDEQSEPRKKKKKKKKKHDEEISDDEKSKKQKTDERSGLDVENPYSGSSIVELDGYPGWTIDSSVEEIIKKKEKQKKRKK